MCHIYIYIYGHKSIFENWKTLKGEEKKAHWPWTSGSKEQHSSEFPAFSFCLMYPGLNARNASQHRHKSSKKSLVPLAKGSAKGQPRKTDNSWKPLLKSNVIPPPSAKAECGA